MSIINKATDTAADALMAIATNEKLAEKVGELVTDMTVLKAEFKIEQEKTAKLEEETATLKEKIAMQDNEIALLKNEITMLKNRIAILESEIATIKYENEILKNENEIIKKEITKQNYKIAMLEKENTMIHN